MLRRFYQYICIKIATSSGQINECSPRLEFPVAIGNQRTAWHRLAFLVLQCISRSFSWAFEAYRALFWCPPTMASKVKDGDFASLQFPWKLHALLEKCDDKEECSISWLPGGKSFQVHDKAIFATNVMPAYFKSAVYKSFQRNLNLWGWKTVSKEEGRAIYHHEHFVRGKPELCHNMVRGSVPPKVIVRPTEDSVSNTESGDPQVGDEVQPSNTAGLHNVSALPSFLQNSIEHVNSSREEADSGLAEAIKNASNSTLFGLLSPQLFQEAAGSFFAAETIMKSQLLLAQALSKRHDETLRAAASLGGTASFLNLGAATNNLPAGAPSLAGRYTPEGPAAVAIVANIASSSSSSAAPQQVPTSSQGPVRKRKFNPTLFAAGDHHASGEIVSPSTTEVYEPTYDVVPCRARAMPLDHNPHVRSRYSLISLAINSSC